MSEDHAGFPFPLPPPLARASAYLRTQGQEFPVSALRLLAREVILRVSSASARDVLQGATPPRAEIELLCDALLSTDETAGADLVRAARMHGMPAEMLYHHYIAEAVRMCGDRWERDEATAAQVILAAGRVYGILRDLRAVFLADHLVAAPGAEAVFAAVPGETHGVGVTIAADTMRQKGWDIALRVGLGHTALVEEIASLRPTMVGLSLSLPSHVLATARLIVALRVRCPQVWIMLAGSLIAEDPGIPDLVDADAGAADIDDAARKLAAHLSDLNRLRSASA
jgi:MerR family transcriptional regulator, light-induced transcriptional regulator